MPLGITHKRTGINSIVDFLVVERLSRNVDGLEPFQLLRLFTFAHIYCQLIVKDSLLYVSWLIEIILLVYAESSSNILTKRKRALLSVHHFVGALCIFTPFHPIHYIERITLQHGLYHGLLFFVIIDELTLIFWTDIEETIKSSHSFLFVVDITFGYLTNSHNYLLYGHHTRGCLLRMNILLASE